MDNNLNKPLDQQTFTNSSIANKEYEPVDILDLGYDPDYLQTVDDEYLDMVTTISPYMNGIPGSAQVVPQQKQAPVANTWFDVKQTFNEPSQREIKPRQAFSIRDTNFDRYYAHPKFADLGFNPYRDNETYYNENSTWYDNFSRAMSQFGANFSPAFSFFGLTDAMFDNNNQGVFDLFDASADTESAVRMSEAMRIGNDSREGFGAAFNRFALNSAYSIGIMSSIAAEEIAMWGATAALAAATPFTGGASGAAAAATGAAATARTAYNVAKLSKMFARMGDAFAVGRVFKGGRSIVGALKNADKARDFWTGIKSGENLAGRIFLPETMQALRSFDKTKDVGTAIHKLGKGYAAFGGFYRDIRMIDLALDESRLEAGFVYNNMIANGIQIERDKTGQVNLTDAQLAAIQKEAVKASSTTTWANAPVIYATNRISLGAVVSPFSRGLARALDASTGKLGRKIIKTKKTVGVDGKISRSPFEVKRSIWTKAGRQQRKNAYSFGDYVMKGAHGALRFFAANIAEGVQELYQEGLQVGVVDYYSELLKDPATDTRVALNAALNKAIDSQYSAQGFEVFMSGFATGGILGGGSKLIYNTVPDTYNRVFNKEEFQKNKQDRENLLNTLVKTANEKWDQQAELNSLFDTANLNFVKVRQAAAEQQRSAYEQDPLGFKDNQDYLEFAQLESLLQNDMIEPFRKQLKDLMNLSDEELAQAFPNAVKDAKSGKVRKRLQDYLDKSYKIEDNYNELNDKFPNPYDASAYKKGSREYNNELYKQIAWNHARYLAMFTRTAFEDSLKRMQTIANELSSSDLVYVPGTEGGINISKLGASDLTTLLDPDTISREISLLQAEIIALKESEADAELLAKKEKKLKLLNNYRKVLTDPKNQISTKGKDGATRFDKRKIGSLTTIASELEEVNGEKVLKATETSTLEKAFVAYIEFLAEENGAYANKAKVKEVLKKMVDYGELQYRTRAYDKAVEFMANPGNFESIVERGAAFFKQQYEQDRKAVRERIDAAINKEEAAQVLKDLDELGIVPDPAEAELFLETGNPEFLQTFYTENGLVQKTVDADKVIEIERIKNNYIKLTQPEEVQDAEDIEEELDEDAPDSDKAAKVINNDESVNAFAKGILRRIHKGVNAARTATGKQRLSLEQYSASKEGQKIASILTDLKALWVASLDQSKPDIADVIKEERGFKEWIQANKDNDQVRELVIDAGESVGLSFEVLSDQKQSTPANSKDKIVEERAGVRIRKTKAKVEGKLVDQYIVELSNGAEISDELYEAAGIDKSKIRASYSKISDAKKVWRSLLSTVPETDPFEFAGQTLHYGDIVVDKKGKRYVSLGTPAKVESNGTLFIVPEEDIEKYKTTKQREKAAIRVTADEFKSKFSVLEESFAETLVTKDMPRVGIPNILGVYPMSDTLDREEGETILSILLQNLSAEDLQEIRVFADVNEESSDLFDFKDSKGKVNPLIKYTKESHSFRLVIADPEVRNKVNNILKENGHSGSITSVDIQLPSGNLKFFAEDGSEVNPFTLSKEQAKKYFSDPVAAIRALATQQIIRKRILDRTDDYENMFLSDFVEMLSVRQGYSNLYSDTQTAVESLPYNTYDGEFVVIDYSYRLDPQTKKRNRIIDVKTNYPKGSKEHKELRNKVLAELNNKKLQNGTSLLDYLKSDRTTDRYHAVIKTPNGNIVFAPLKSTALDQESKDGLLQEMLDRAAKTAEENVDTVEGKKVVKSKGYNDTFNDEFNDKFYISLKSGYDAQLKVSARGALELVLIDTVNDKKLFSAFVDPSATEVDSFDKLMSALNAAMNADATVKSLKLKATSDSFRKNIPTEISAQAIRYLTTTNINPEAFYDVYLDYSVDEASVEEYIGAQRALDSVADDDVADNSNAQETLDNLNNQLSTATVDELSEEEFEELRANNFEGIDSEFLDAIAANYAVGEALSEREGIVYNVLTNMIEFKASQLKSQTKADDDYVEAKNEYDKAKAAREAYVADLKAKVDAGELTNKDLTNILVGGVDQAYNELNDEFKKRERILSSFAPKIVDEDFSVEDVEDIDTFITWAAENLPEFVQIRDISEVAERLKTNGIPVGLFAMHLRNLAGQLEIGGTVYVGSKGFRYHEAFHAVFRLLLSEEEQTKYLAIAANEVRAKLKAEGKTLAEELQKFKNSAEKYQNMSEKQLKREYYEEYLADEFEKFKTNPRSTETSSVIKSFFNRLIEWIKNVFGTYSVSELQKLFRNIDAGKYKSAGVQNNMFTQGLKPGVTLEAFKVLAYDEIELERGVAKKYLDPDTADTLIRTMTGTYLTRLQGGKIEDQETRQELVMRVIEDFRELYDPMADHNSNKSGDQIEKMIKIYTALGGVIGEETVEKTIKKAEYEKNTYDAVAQYISLFDRQIKDEEYANEEIEYDQGLRGVGDWNTDQSMIGGFSSLPVAFRAFIGTTKIEATDEFGNAELLDGKGAIFIPVDYQSAYNGLLKSVKNLTDEISILRAMLSFSKGNRQTAAVVDKIFRTLGTSEEIVLTGTREEILDSITNRVFFNELYKGLENFRVDYLFAHVNTKRGVQGRKLLLYNAANRDDAANQIDVWKQSHNERFKAIKESEVDMLNAVDALESLLPYLETMEEMEDSELSSVATQISNDIYETVGIKLSPAYIEFTIAKNIQNRTPYQQSLVESNKQAEGISKDTIVEFTKQLQLNKTSRRKSAYLFTRKGGIKSRLQLLAKNNALFDETIGQSVFLNAEGNFVYAHQMPTYHLKMVQELNDASFLKDLRQRQEGYNLTNILLNSPAFMQLSEEERLSVLRIAGTKESALGSTDENALDENGGVALDKDGKTYGSLTGAEFTATLVNSYLANYQAFKQQNKTVVFTNEDNEVVETALAPVLIRVIEASNTGDLLSLPIIKTVEFDASGQVTITEPTVNLFFEELRREFERIQRESSKADEDKVPIEGYNAKNGVLTDNEGRAYQFNDTASLLKTTKEEETRVDAKDPKFTSEIGNRVLEGTQKTVYVSDAQAKTIGLTLKNTRANVTVRSGKQEGVFVLRALGQTKVDSTNISNIVKSMGDAVQLEKSKQFNFAVNVGDTTLYVETKVMKDFLEGKKTRFGYELVPYDQFQEEIATQQEFDFKEELEQIAINNPDISLEEAIGMLNESSVTVSDFKDLLKTRLMSEYERFAQELDNLRVKDLISSDILNGITDDNGVAQGDAAMEQLNLVRDNEDYNLMQIFFNDWLNTKAINQLLLGDQAVSLKDSVDKVKRAKMQNASYKSAYTPVIDESRGVYHATENISLVTFSDTLFNKKYSGGQGERTDAQVYITTKALRHMLFGFAELTQDKAELLNKLERGETVTPKEYYAAGGHIKQGSVFNSLKLVYGDGQTFLKMSAVVLTPELTTRKDGTAKAQYEELHNLRLKLEKIEADGDQTIAMAAPASASKMMKPNVVSNEAAFGQFNPNAQALPHTMLNARFIGLQLVNPSNKQKITDPTQLRSLITSEQVDTVEVMIKTLDGYVSKTLGELRELYNRGTAARLNLKYHNKVNLIADFSLETAMRSLDDSRKLGSLTIELRDFLQFAQEGLKASQASSNVIEFFDPSGQYDLNNPMVIDKFEQLFLSYFTKETMSEKVAGDALALMSDSGVKVIRRVFSVDENGVPDKFEVIRDKVYNSNPLPIEIDIDSEGNLVGLADAIERSNGKGVIVRDELRHNLKEYDQDGNFTGVRYTESIMPAFSEQIMEMIEETGKPMPDAFAKMFAVRIPSQDKHSALATKVVDFLPSSYGSTAIFSKELIEISGADFDIDKVYTQMKQWYIKNGKFIEYGDTTRTDQEQFDDYIHYVGKEINSPSSVYAKALEKGKRRLRREGQYTDLQARLIGKGITTSLKVLGLPTTVEEFVAYRDKFGYPYEAALNNQLLDYKFALWGNEGNTVARKDGENPIAYDPAVLTPLTDVWEDIQKELPELAQLVEEEGIDVDNLFGKGRAFKNNKEGAGAIGAAVLPNLYLNLLGEYNIEIRSKVVGGQTIPQIEFNGVRYNKFNEQYERLAKDGKETQGNRTQFIISALITAMTDNAKERLAAKLGLNRDALAVVTTLTKLGVPIKTSILLVNHPIIREEYFAANNKRRATDPGIATRIQSIIKTLELDFADAGIRTNTVQVSDELLKEQIRKGDDLVVNPEMDFEEASAIYSILKQFIAAHNVKSFLSDMSSVMNISKGPGRTFADVNQKLTEIKNLGVGLSDKEFADLEFKGAPVPIDVRPIFKSDAWQANMVKVLNHFSNVILPNVFVSKTPAFDRLLSATLRNLTSNDYVLDAEQKDKIGKDLLSYLTIKAYMHSLDKKGSQMSLGSLNNAFIYPQSGAALNINGLVDQLRKIYPDNFFLNEFMFNENARDLDNKSGIHKAESNTFGKRSDIDKLRIQNSFIEIFSNNRLEATHLIHYMMVKDGLQFGAGSLLEAVTPALLDTFSTSIEDIHDMMKKDRLDLFESKFGMSYPELLNDFVLGYLQSNKNNILLNRVSNIPFYKQIFEETEVLPGQVNKKIVEANPDKVYVYVDNARQLGTVGSSTVRGMENALPLTLMYDLTTMFDSEDLDSFVERFDTEVNDILESGKPIVFPKQLLDKKQLKKLKSASKDVYNYIEEKLRQEFGYSLTKGVLTETGSTTQRAINVAPIAMSLTNEENVLIVDIYKGVKPFKRSGNTQNTRKFGDRFNENQFKKLAKNIRELERKGFVIKKDIIINGKRTFVVELPAVLKVVTGKKNKTVRYFRLKETYTPVTVTEDNIINSSEGMSIGNAGVYEEIKMKGSNYQNGIGFMFDGGGFERPAYTDIRTFVEKLEKEGGFEEGFLPVSEQAVLSKAKTMGYDIEYIGNTVYVNLNSFAPGGVEKNLVKVSDLTMEMLEENDLGPTAEDFDEYGPGGGGGVEADVTSEEVDASDVTSQGVDASDRPPVSLSLFDQLEETNLEEEYPAIVDFWDKNVQTNPEARQKLRDQNINDLEDFIAQRNDPDVIYDSDEDFLDNIKSCIL